MLIIISFKIYNYPSLLDYHVQGAMLEKYHKLQQKHKTTN